jgi:hypothetical protein
MPEKILIMVQRVVLRLFSIVAMSEVEVNGENIPNNKGKW